METTNYGASNSEDDLGQDFFAFDIDYNLNNNNNLDDECIEDAFEDFQPENDNFTSLPFGMETTNYGPGNSKDVDDSEDNFGQYFFDIDNNLNNNNNNNLDKFNLMHWRISAL